MRPDPRFMGLLVHFLHGTARVLLRPTGGPADHFRDKVLEACGGNTMMSLIYPWVDPIATMVIGSSLTNLCAKRASGLASRT